MARLQMPKAGSAYVAERCLGFRVRHTQGGPNRKFVGFELREASDDWALKAERYIKRALYKIRAGANWGWLADF
jgi:hypothetical protein